MDFGIGICDEHWEILDDVYSLGAHKLKDNGPWTAIDSSIEMYRLVRTELNSRDLQDKLMGNILKDFRRVR